MQKPTMQQFLSVLRELATNKDRYIKGHAKDLLKRLQSINPQDEVCKYCNHTGMIEDNEGDHYCEACEMYQ